MRCLLIALLLLAPAAARAARVLVVVPDTISASYREALEGFRSEIWEEKLEIVLATRAFPPGPHGVIVAFGGRAVTKARLDFSPMVAVLAPSYQEEIRPRSASVALTPSPERFVNLLATAKVHRLLAVRATPASPEFARRAAAAGKRFGVVIEDHILEPSASLPEFLRGETRSFDAIWLAPDPGVVTRERFNVAREFARARSIPFFAPAAGLVSDEIHGELTVTFRDCGREAARAARELLAGRNIRGIVYPAAPLSGAKVQVSTTSAGRP